MGIMIKHIRISNYRSLKSVDVQLGMTNILIGQNNSGKTNFLKAIDIALNGIQHVSSDDIYVEHNEVLKSDKTAIIDILVIPTDENNNRVNNFNTFWTGVFTEKWITTDETNGDYVGIRTSIEYDLRRNDYILTRRAIKEWNESIDRSKVGNKQQLGAEVAEYMNSFFMDAQRDVSDDIRNKKSYFGRATSKIDLTDDKIEELEDKLNNVNDEIMSNIPALQKTAQKIAAIGGTLGGAGSSVQIQPLSRKLGDLHKGMDITFKDGIAASFSISQHGMGTRSWISFLTLGAYVEWFYTQVKEDDEEAEDYVMLTLEEPEAHLHPQAQRQLYSQITEFRGQKIVSTHSPSILAQADLGEIIHFYKKDGATTVKCFQSDYTQQELDKIRREVINTRGELLFSNAIILCEGITEEQALPIYFKAYFGTEPTYKGINIIGIGGQNYRTFLNLIKNFEIDWYIFSDGEEKTVKNVKKAITVITEENITNLKNVVVLENEEDYERHLIASGYSDEIIAAINSIEGVVDHFEQFRQSKNHTKNGRQKTDKPICQTCNQEIYEDIIRDYDGEEGCKQALYDCCTTSSGKAKYATAVAKHITELTEPERKVPSKVKELFKELAIRQGLQERSEFSET